MSGEALAAASSVERFKLDLVRELSGGGRLLDVGPGGGGFASLALDAGFDVEVMDFSAEVCAGLERELGVLGHVEDASSADFRSIGPFDVITMWQVFEHLENPAAVLQAALSGLAEGGHLVIAVPNPHALQLRLMRGWWPHVDAPRHRCLVPARQLVRAAASHGAATVRVTYADPGSIGWNRFGWTVFLAGLLGRGQSTDAGSRVLRGMLVFGGKALARAAAFAEKRGDRGAAYTVVFRAPGSTVD